MMPTEAPDGRQHGPRLLGHGPSAATDRVGEPDRDAGDEGRSGQNPATGRPGFQETTSGAHEGRRLDSSRRRRRRSAVLTVPAGGFKTEVGCEV